MKRIWLLICLAVMLLALVGCEKPTMTPIDVRYTEAHSEIKTEYTHKYDFWSGSFVYVPNIRTVHINEKYEVMYELSWSDGTKRIEDFYRTVTKEEYDRACDFLEEQNGKA